MPEVVLPQTPPWIAAVGKVSYRYRQHLQVVLLAVCLVVGRPLASSRAEGALLACALLLVLTGGAIRSWAMGYHTWRRVKGEAARRTLVTAGPYAHTRNPLYLGSFMIGCGVAAMSGRLWILLAFAAVFVASHYCIIRWEETRLDQEFGIAFRNYAAEVPRFFPGFRTASGRVGRYDLATMWRCMEPIKTAGFAAAVLLMAWLKSAGWTLGS